MIKLWTWSPFPRTFSRHKDWSDCLQHLDAMIEEYEAFQNKFVHAHNEHAEKHNASFPKSKIERKKDFELNSNDILDSITCFDTKINETFLDWKKNGKSTQISAI